MKKLLITLTMGISLAMFASKKEHTGIMALPTEPGIVVDFKNVLNENTAVKTVTFRFEDGAVKQGIIKDSKAYLPRNFVDKTNKVLSIIVERINIITGRSDLSIIEEQLPVNRFMKTLHVNVQGSHVV